jgi:hypothetical protein
VSSEGASSEGASSEGASSEGASSEEESEEDEKIKELLGLRDNTVKVTWLITILAHGGPRRPWTKYI